MKQIVFVPKVLTSARYLNSISSLQTNIVRKKPNKHYWLSLSIGGSVCTKVWDTDYSNLKQRIMIHQTSIIG